MNKADTFEFYRRLAETNPAPVTELEYGNHFQLLVAVVLSAQATDVGVNKATRALFEIVKTPEQMVALGEEGLVNYIKSIGLFRTKAKNVIALSQQLLERHGGDVPDSMAELVALPGVGRKTANVVLSQLFGHPTIAVDTHVYRVARRLGLSRGTTPEAVEAKYGLTPAQYPDFAALRGDPSDNLPGIPGVGEKTATKWITEYGSLQQLIDQVDTVRGKVGDSLRANVGSVLRGTGVFTNAHFDVNHFWSVHPGGATFATADGHALGARLNTARKGGLHAAAGQVHLHFGLRVLFLDGAGDTFDAMLAAHAFDQKFVLSGVHVMEPFCVAPDVMCLPGQDG